LYTLKSSSEILGKCLNVGLEKEERNILRTVKVSKAKWFGHFLGRNCLPRYVIEVNIEGWVEVTGRRGRRRKQLVDVQQTRWCCKFKEEALDRTL